MAATIAMAGRTTSANGVAICPRSNAALSPRTNCIAIATAKRIAAIEPRTRKLLSALPSA